MKKRVDVIVIGAGSGLRIAAKAAELGKSVAVIEPSKFGGTCLNRGCIPSKMLIHSADVAQTIKESKLFGISSKMVKIDWKKIVRKVTSFVDKEAAKLKQSNSRDKYITIFSGKAQFIAKKTVRVGKAELTADKIFICAGCRPFIPPIPGLDKVAYLTSDNALRLTKQPKHLIILGGGYIGCELAHFFGELGTTITIIDRGDMLMKNEDSDIAREFTKIYRKRYNLVMNASVERVEKKKQKIRVHLKNKVIEGDALLIATGRKSNADTLNCKAAGVELTKHGFVKTNEYLETNVPGIFAIGDIAGKWMFKHSANLEAEAAVHNAFKRKIPVDYTAMPHAAFTSPQVAGVGDTEDELKEKKTPYLSSTYSFYDTGYGRAIEDHGFVKALIDPKTRKILGCHIIGTDASILIHEVLVAMRNGLTANDLAKTIHVHPALSEVVQRAFAKFP